jgi:hypothetical protein
MILAWASCSQNRLLSSYFCKAIATIIRYRVKSSRGNIKLPITWASALDTAPETDAVFIWRTIPKPL